MKDRLRPGFQRQRHHRLRDPVGHGRHPEDPVSHRHCGLGISTAFTGGGKYVPDDIRFQILYRLFLRSASNVRDGLPVHPGGTLVGPDSLVRLPHQLLRISQTACPLNLTCPLVSSQDNVPVARANNSSMSRPLRSTPITGASPLLRAGPPARHRVGTQRLRFPPSATLPLAHPDRQRGRQCRHPPSHVPCRSRRPGSRRLHAGHRLANKRAPARLIPETLELPRFRCHLACFDTSSAVRSRSPSRSPPDASRAPFPHRSPRRSSTNAA